MDCWQYQVFAEDRATHLMEECTETVFSMEKKSHFLVIEVMICLETANCVCLGQKNVFASENLSCFRLMTLFEALLISKYQTF